MVSISCYKNKDVGILGAGLSGMAAAKILLSSKANVFIFDDKKSKPDFIKKHNWKNYIFWPWESLATLVVSPGIPINSTTKHNAIQLAIEACNIGDGDEILVPSMTYVATFQAIKACGAKPILIDCDERYQININKIEKSITKKTKVIMPVHWGGASPNMYEIIKIAKKNKLKVIEDACMGIGASLRGKSPGTFGDVSAFSLHPLKSLNAMGDWINLDIYTGNPAHLADKLKQGELDFAMIPAIEYLKQADRVRLFPGISIASRNQVGTVLLDTLY